MSLLRKAEKVRKASGGTAGLLARAMIYRRSMETARLHTLAADSQDTAVGVSEGLLAKATRAEKAEPVEAYAGEEPLQPHGLLARAMQFQREATVPGEFRKEPFIEVSEGAVEPEVRAVSKEEPPLSENGLLAKALRYRMGVPGEEGLLHKAEALTISEGYEEPVVTGGEVSETEVSEFTYEPVEAGDFIAEEKIPIKEIEEEMPGLEEVIEEAPESIEEEQVQLIEEIPEEPQVEEVIKEKPVKIPEEKPEERQKPAVIRYTEAHDALAMSGLFSQIVAEDGYKTLMQQVLEAAVHAGRGKTGVLFTLRKSSFIPECVHGIERGKKGKKSTPSRIGIRIRKKSDLAGYLKDRGTTLVRRTEIDDEKIVPDLLQLVDLEPFTLVPLVTGEVLSGIIVIGNHAKRPKQDREGLLLLARIFSIHLYTFVLERTLQKTIEEYADTNRQLTRLVSLYDFAGFRGIELHNVLKSIGETFGIEAAVLTGGWNSRGSVYVYAGFGFSEKGLARYRVPKTNKVIRALIKNNAPGIFPDQEKLIERLPQEDRRKAGPVAAVPVTFDEEVLGVLFVHGMEGIRTRVSSKSAVVLKNIAQTLVPFLLYTRMAELEPYEVLERLLTQEAQKAKKKRALLHIVAFKIKNYRALIKQSGFKGYRNLLHRFSTLVRKNVERGDAVRTVALNKVVLLMIRKDPEAVGETIKRVKSAIGELLDKKKRGVVLSYSPLRTSYPNESRSIPEILQLIE